MDSIALELVVVVEKKDLPKKILYYKKKKLKIKYLLWSLYKPTIKVWMFKKLEDVTLISESLSISKMFISFTNPYDIRLSPDHLVLLIISFVDLDMKMNFLVFLGASTSYRKLKTVFSKTIIDPCNSNS